MKFLISTDIEGIAGLTGRGFQDEHSVEYKEACKLLTNETNVIVEELFNKGATVVRVTDGHGSGTNIIPEKLDPRAILFNEKRGKLSMVDGVEGVDYCIFVGYHGMAAKPKSYCAHTNASKTIASVKLNRIDVGEGQINALIAKQFGIKLILYIGTDVAVEEMKEFLDVPSVITKKSVGQFECELKDTDIVYANIRNAIKDALAKKDDIQFIKLETDVEWEVTAKDGSQTTIKKQNVLDGFQEYRMLLKKLRNL